jgi:hypothetical protein
LRFQGLTEKKPPKKERRIDRRVSRSLNALSRFLWSALLRKIVLCDSGYVLLSRLGP